MICYDVEGFSLRLDERGRVVGFDEPESERNYLLNEAPVPLAKVRQGTEWSDVRSIVETEQGLRLAFGDGTVQVQLAVENRRRYLVLKVLSVEPSVDELVLLDLELSLQCTPDDSLAACAVALNVETNVLGIPGPNAHLRASSYARFGHKGAVAVVGCSPRCLRELLQQVVEGAPELPHSPLGGPWAEDGEKNRGSYIFDFGTLSETNVEEWIAAAQRFGMRQIDFHIGRSLRFGDFHPNPELFPDGYASLKRIIHKLHEAGLQAGLHTYAFFIDKASSYVTPKPDPRLGSFGCFTLSRPVSPLDTEIRVEESTAEMRLDTGFFVRNSVTLRIDDELVVFGGVSPEGFVQCKRGAHGTQPQAHPLGSKAYHLKECFGLFAPDGDSSLLTELARRTASVYNECGFDMLYLDAIDGEDLLEGPEWGWHYGSRFVFTLWQALQKPAVVEMSTFHHHYWFVRSRMGAWDCPNRSYSHFVDLHCASNQKMQAHYMPVNLGWFSFYQRPSQDDWSRYIQGEPTFSEDVEYLCCKSLGRDASLSLQSISPELLKRSAVAKLAPLIARYEQLRLNRMVPESVLSQLRQPGKAFTLLSKQDEQPCWQELAWQKQVFTEVDGAKKLHNPFAEHCPSFRLEVLPDVDCSSADEVLLAPGDPLITEASGDDVTLSIERGGQCTPDGGEILSLRVTGACRARSSSSIDVGPHAGEHGVMLSRKNDGSAWVMCRRVFDPPLDLRSQPGLGLWVWSEGRGGVLNVQLRSPVHLSPAISDHYVRLDKAGWNYVTFVEPEGAEVLRYNLPYSDRLYSFFREAVDYGQISEVSLWLTDFPDDDPFDCSIGPLKAYPLVPTSIKRPVIECDGQHVVFPVTMDTGWYLEYDGQEQAVVHDPSGQAVQQLTPEGDALVAAKGCSRWTVSSASGARTQLTAFFRGNQLDARSGD